MKIIIPGELPGLNEIITAAKAHPKRYADMKRANTSRVIAAAHRAPHMVRVDVVITWVCKDKRRDKDNIMAGQKFVFDGLHKGGVLDNDGWQQIGDVAHKFGVDKSNPRVEVELIEVEPIDKKEIDRLRKRYATAVKRANKASEARQALPAGSTRARITSANARWASAAEERDRIAQKLAELGVDVMQT